MAVSARMQAGSPAWTPAPAGEKAFAVIAVGFAASLICGGLSDGYHHADDLTHYLFARWAWTYPEYLLHDWGRPGFTVLYFLPAALGWSAARAWSALLSAIVAWLTYRIARRLGVSRPWIAPLLLYAQPAYFTLSLTTLTETALALYLTLALWLALRRRWAAAAAVLSLGLTARHEAAALLPVFVLAAIVDGQPLRRLLPLAWAPLVVNVLAWITGMDAPIARLFHPLGGGGYGRGGIYEFFCRSLEAFGPAIAALGFAGVSTTLRFRGGPLLVGLALSYFATHALVRWLGLYDSGGYGRFLVPIAPLWAIMATAAWNRLTHSDSLRRARIVLGVAAAMILLWISMELMIRLQLRDIEVPRLWEAQWAVRVATGVTALLAYFAWQQDHGRRIRTALATAPLRLALALLVMLTVLVMHRPLHPKADELAVGRLIDWLHAGPYGDRPVVATHVWGAYRLGVPQPLRLSRAAVAIAEARPGTILIWDEQFGPAQSPPLKLEALTPPAFRPLPVPNAIADPRGRIRAFEKAGPASPGPT